MKDKEKVESHSNWTLLSWNSGWTASRLINQFVGIQLFFFYEVEVLLPVIFIGIAMTIQSIWDIVNDPYFGYLTDKPRRFTKRWGRRFPWIIIGGIPYLIVFLLLFSPPDIDPLVNPWPVFIWFLLVLFFSELFYEITFGTMSSLYPEKYRSDNDRRKIEVIGSYAETFSAVFGLIIPLLLIVQGDKSSYLLIAFLIFVVSVIFWLLGIPSYREDKEMIERVLQQYAEEKRYSYVRELKIALKNKNFLVYILVAIATATSSNLVTASLYYWAFYVLNIPPEANLEAFIVIIMYLSIVITTPIWMVISKRLGNRKVMMLAGLSIAAVILSILFVTDFTGALIIAFFYGFGIAGQYISLVPIFGDAVDDLVVSTETKKEGLYAGIREVVIKVGLLFTPMILTITHIVTGFDPVSPVQTPLAQQGIIWGMGVIPAIILIITVLIFWKFYDLTPEKKMANRERLKELS
jgi:GPH family glycoside/pentoside/hexuronide:cation symporter